jgi:small-conductance mechanosensitive channel
MEFKDILNNPIIETEKLTITVFSLFEVFIIIVVTSALLWVIKKFLKRQSKTTRLEVGTSHAILQIIRYVLWIIAIMMIFQAIGFKITFLLAGSAALLVGIGLGVQEVFKDLISGFFMLFEGNLRVSDIVELEGNLVGKVVQIGLRTTKIETRDRVVLIIPNSKFISDRLINWSHMEKKTRFHVNVGVAYGSDVDKVTSILREVAEDHPKVAKDPRPVVMFYDFGNSSLDFKLHFWTYDTFWVEIIKSDLRYAINNKFIENKVTIPFPQRDVHIRTFRKPEE